MVLVVDLGVGPQHPAIPIGQLRIRRRTPLEDRQRPDDEVHEYSVLYLGKRRTEDLAGSCTHRYGDGALVLLAKALLSVGISAIDQKDADIDV